MDALAWGRLAERLFIVAFSGLSMILGWHLFLRGVVDDQEAEGQFKDWKITLKKVGPGVFFAFFGAAVLAFSLAQPMSIDKGSPDDHTSIDDQPTPTEHFVYLGGDDKEFKRAVRAINTVLKLDMEKVTIGNTEIMPNDLVAAKKPLEKLRNVLLLQRSEITQDSIVRWIKYGSDFKLDVTKVPAEYRQELSDLQSWFEDTMAMEGER